MFLGIGVKGGVNKYVFVVRVMNCVSEYNFCISGCEIYVLCLNKRILGENERVFW